MSDIRNYWDVSGIEGECAPSLGSSPHDGYDRQHEEDEGAQDDDSTQLWQRREDGVDEDRHARDVLERAERAQRAN